MVREKTFPEEKMFPQGKNVSLRMDSGWGRVATLTLT